MKDYFTRAEFRNFVGDTADPQKYSDSAIDEAQKEVIDELERWADSAWPNVTGIDGDGTAAAPRSAVETFDPDESFIVSRVPIIEITEITDDAVVVDATRYDVYLEEGVIAAPNGLGSKVRGVVISYTYGFDSTPFAVKHAAMQATKAMLDQAKGKGSRIPPNTSQMQTETTTLVFKDVTDDNLRPWPWAPSASQAVRSYWSDQRPMTAGAI